MTIREFVDSHNTWNTTSNNWREFLKEQGYYSVSAGAGSWADIHEWCDQHIGEQHYTWTGEVFWFETEQAAVMFALRWA